MLCIRKPSGSGTGNNCHGTLVEKSRAVAGIREPVDEIFEKRRDIGNIVGRCKNYAFSMKQLFFNDRPGILKGTGVLSFEKTYMTPPALLQMNIPDIDGGNFNITSFFISFPISSTMRVVFPFLGLPMITRIFMFYRSLILSGYL